MNRAILTNVSVLDVNYNQLQHSCVLVLQCWQAVTQQKQTNKKITVLLMGKIYFEVWADKTKYLTTKVCNFDLHDATLVQYQLQNCVCQTFIKTAKQIEMAFGKEAFFQPILHCVVRKFRYLQT